MKDEFFLWCEKSYEVVFRSVTRVAYNVICHRMTKGLPDISGEEKKTIKKYWKDTYGVNIPLYQYKWYKAKGVELDPKLIPDTLWHAKIEPYLGNLSMMKAFSDKNYLDMFIGETNTPVTLCRCISGQLLDQHYNNKTVCELCNVLKNETEVICKPSIDSGGGRGICFLKGVDFTASKLEELIKLFSGNFLIQKEIHQHEFFARFNPNSLNSMRVITLLFNNQVHILTGFFRVGAEGMKVDNISSGGFYRGITKNGIILNRAFKENFANHDMCYDEELTRKLDLQNERIPFWGDIVNLLTQSHYRLSHFKLVNWDVSVDTTGKPIIVECNLIDGSAFYHQLNIGPIFGDLTESVLSEVFGKVK